MSFLKTSHASAAMSPPAPITTSSSRSLPSLAPQPAPRCIWGSPPLSAAPWWGGLLETPHLKHRPLPPRRSAHFSCTVGRSHASPSAAHLGAATPEAAFSLLAGHLPRLRGGGPRVCLLVPSIPGHGAALGQSALGPHLRAGAQEDAQVSEGPQGPGPEQARASCASPPSPLGPCPPFWGCCPNAPCSGLSVDVRSPSPVAGGVRGRVPQLGRAGEHGSEPQGAQSPSAGPLHLASPSGPPTSAPPGPPNPESLP